MAMSIKEILAKRAAEKEVANSAAEIIPTVEVSEPKAEPKSDPFADLDVELSEEELAEHTDLGELVELESGVIDPRLKLLSHSSRTLLHTCPRKYQLYRLNSTKVEAKGEEARVKDMEQKVTFAYGSAVGVGIQSVLEGKSIDQCLMDVFLEWDIDLLLETKRQNKSIWLALFATTKFHMMRESGFLADYELVTYQGRPAVELSFSVELPNGFYYRGYLDAVIKHKVTGEVIVVESKTSSGKTNAANFKNSGQAVGYSVALDELFPELSSYKVLYLVYETKSYDFVELPFTKSLYQRALWLQELMLDTKIIELYSEYEVFPMCGHSCFNFFKECEYLGTCTLPTENLVKPLRTSMLDDINKSLKEYEFSVSFDALVERQLLKGEDHE